MIPTYNAGVANIVQYVYDIVLPNTIDISRDKNFTLKYSFHNQKISTPQSGVDDVLFSQKLCDVITAFFGYLGERFTANWNCRVTVFFPEGSSNVLRFTVEYNASIHMLVMVYALYRPDLLHVGDIISPNNVNQEVIINPVEENIGHLSDTVKAISDWKVRHNARAVSAISFGRGVLIITEDYRPTVLCDFGAIVDLTEYTPYKDPAMFTYGGCNNESFGRHQDVVRALNEHHIWDGQYIYLVSEALYRLTRGFVTPIEMDLHDKGILFHVVTDCGMPLDWYRKTIEVRTAARTRVNHDRNTVDDRNQIMLVYPEGCGFPAASKTSIIYCDPFDPDSNITVDDYWTQFEDYVSDCMVNTDGHSSNDDIVIALKDALKSVPHVLRLHLTPSGIHMSFYEEWVSAVVVPKPQSNVESFTPSLRLDPQLLESLLLVKRAMQSSPIARDLIQAYLNP